MDPDANYAEQIRLARDLQNSYDNPELDFDPDKVGRLAELVLALNDWMANGGLPPAKFRSTK